MYRIAALVLAAGFLFAPYVHAQDGWGDVKGRIVWGPKVLPKQTKVDVSKNADKAQCLKNGDVMTQKWVVNPKNRGLNATFVWLIDAKDPKKALPINPALKDVNGPNPSVDQPACAFIPHAVAMRVGQTLIAKNSSAIAHNIKWTGVKNQGNVIVPAGAEFKVQDLVAERLPLIIECNIHPWMKGFVGIFNHPYYALTDANGNFEIKGAPAGTYRLVIWNDGYSNGAKGNRGVEITIMPNGVTKLGELKFTPPPAN